MEPSLRPTRGDKLRKLYSAQLLTQSNHLMKSNALHGLPGLLLALGLVSGSITLPACTAVTNDPSSSNPEALSISETERLNRWFEQKYEEQLQRSPMSLTTRGRKEHYDKIDDFSEAAADLEFDIATQDVNELRNNFDYQLLNDDAKLSFDLWMYQYERSVRAREFRDHDYVFDQMSAVQSYFTTFMINYHRVDERADMEAYIDRLSGIGTALRTLLKRAQAYAAAGVRPPRFAYEGVIEQAGKIIKGAPFDARTSAAAGESQDSAIWQDATAKIAALQANNKIDAAQAATLTASTRAALLTGFAPAYRDLIDWLQNDLENTSVVATGVGSLPRGEAYYRERLRYSTTTEMTAAEIHQIGLNEVARLNKEMQAVLKALKFKGSLQDFFAFIREDKQFYYTNDDAGRQRYLDEAEAKIDFIRTRLPDYFGLLPKGGLVVKRVEAYRERDGAAQHYYPGTADGSRPAIYYVHLSDMNAVPANQLEVIAYHEGLPGHHMQIAIAQELESVPSFRRKIFFNAYIEGWALYSEWLAIEMGAYKDPYANFGRITSELWRAIRLVVDTGLHAMGWTEAQAINYFASNSPEPIESIRSEVQRYLVMPGQATSYKIGMLKIQELRAKAEKTLGDAFDIKAFHDLVLGGGALPLAMLERRVDDWIEAAQKRSAPH